MNSSLPYLKYYDLLHLVAEGGTAKVYWGRDIRSGYGVAIKELKTKYLHNVAIRKKFVEVETQLYQYMNHPNIPKLVEFVDMGATTGQLFLVMEYVEGLNMDQYIYEKMGPIPEERALPIFLEILDAVKYIHNQQVLHLDIKPSNIILQPNGHIKLIDLGIASRLKDGWNTGFGTLAYMPPEQTDKSGSCGFYTDVFALGVVLFEMLTATQPFRSDYTDASMYRKDLANKIKYNPTPKLREFYPFVGEGLQEIVENALKKKPEERYPSCECFAREIQYYIRNK